MNIFMLADAATAQSLSVLLQQRGHRMALVSADVRAFVAHASTESPDVLLVDDRVLKETPGLTHSVARLACPKVFIGAVEDAHATRRAISLRSFEIVAPDEVERLLPGILARLEGAEEPAAKPQAVFSVVSSKGGVGKSTLALNFAWALSVKSHFPVALIDFDSLGDIATMLPQVPSVSLVDVIESVEAGLDPATILRSLHAMQDTRLTVIPADANPQRSQGITSAHVASIIQLVQTAYPYVVIDTATGFSDMNVAILDACDEIFVMTAPERVTIGPLLRSMPALRQLYAEKLAVVVNRSDSATGLEPSAITEMIGQAPRYVLPSGGAAPVKASNQGQGLVISDPTNPLARAILAMAQGVVTDYEGPHRRVAASE